MQLVLVCLGRNGEDNDDSDENVSKILLNVWEENREKIFGGLF